MTALLERRGHLLALAAVTLTYLTSSGQAPLPPVALAAAVAGVALSLLVLRFPAPGIMIGLAIVIVVPIYYGRYVVGTIAVTPAVAVCLVLTPLALKRLRVWRPVPLDVFVAGFVVLRVASFLLNYQTGPGAAAGFVLSVALPYAVFRLCVPPDLVPRLAPVVVVCAAALSVLALRERMGVENPFFTLLTPSYQGELLARANERLGAVRAEASFGEPISFGMFLGLALVLALHLAVNARSLLLRGLYAGAAGLIMLGLSATQSRGALLVAALGVAGYLLVLVRRLSALRTGALIAAGVALAFSTPFASSVSELVTNSQGDTRESRSAEYRLQILDVVRDPAQFSLLGQQTRQVTHQATTDLSARVGLKSLDSHYALLYLDAGALALVAFGGIAVLVGATALRPGLRPAERAWAMGLAATFVNLLTVALFTQESDLVWMGVGLLGGVGQRVRDQGAPT